MRAHPQDAGELGYKSELALHLATLVEVWGSVAFRARLTDAVDASLNTTDARVLWELAYRGSVRPSVLAAAIEIGAPSISKATSRLVKRGAIILRPDASDGRASILTLTAAGRDLAARLYAVGDNLVRDLTSDWPEGDLAKLTELAGRLAGETVRLEDSPARGL